MKNLLLITVFALSTGLAHAGAQFTRFQAYETSATSAFHGLEDLQTYEVGPQFLKGRVFGFTLQGKKYEVGDVRLIRTSSIHDITLEAQVTLYDEGQPVPPTHSRGMKATIHKPIPISFNLRLPAGKDLGGSPCRDYGCQPSDLLVREWREPATAAQLAKGIRATYFRQSLRIKSVDYDWATGEWDNLVLGETLYHELQLIPKPSTGGGTTVGKN